MNPSELKSRVSEREPYFFDRKTMKFFGDRMSNYGVRKAEITLYTGEKVQVWELYRRRPVKHGLQDSAYFNMVTFKREFNNKAYGIYRPDVTKEV